MKAAKIVDAKDNLSKYLPFVRKGGRVRVMQRGKPIAELVPVAPQEDTLQPFSPLQTLRVRPEGPHSRHQNLVGKDEVSPVVA